MTKERKLEILKDLLIQLSDSANILCTCEADERCEVVEEYIKALEQEPSEDCVSRQAVLDILSHYAHNFGADAEIKALSPVTPTRKIGKWVYDKASQNWRCSVCNETPKTLGYVGTSDFMEKEFVFCNHCGAKMINTERGKE